MIYSNPPLYLIDFIKDPINNTSSVASNYQEPKTRTKIFYKFSILRPFISKKETLKLFESMILSAAEEAANEIAIIDFKKYSLDEQYVKSGVEKLKRKFSIYVKGFSSPEISTKHNDIHLAAKMEYHCNRISEVLNESMSDMHSLVECKSVWQLFYLSEIYFFIKSDYMRLSLSFDGFHVKRKYKNKELLSYWFSEIMEFNSKISYHLLIEKFKQEFRGVDFVNSLQLNAVVDATLDKLFSIHSEYLSSEIKRLKKYKLLRDVVALSLLVELRCYTHGTACISWIQKQNFISFEGLEHIDKILSSNEENKKSKLPKYIYIENDNFKRGSLGYWFGMRKFAGSILHPFKENKNFGSMLGYNFEKEYIFHYLKKLNLPDYEIYEGLHPPSKKNKISGYDIDLIIKDISNNHYYFIQIKLSIFDSPVYLYEQIRTFNEDKYRDAIERQLGIFKNNIEDESIQKRLNNIRIFDANSSNSSYLLIHNLPTFDFYTDQGVQCYEWNTFRNLIKGGATLALGKDSFEERMVNKKFIFSDPESIANEYLNSEVIDNINQYSYHLYENSKSITYLSGNKVTCDIL